ncbi:MAG: leucyl/phenylalanyl-tRNA--protein transferase [Deltaproteobacteria bacterium]|nr:leucyl/phenylalanyl-tRNA--protein transferase [Deltaproteobacteria bacterium]
MPVYLLGEDDVAFPPPSAATPEGIVAVGGDVSPERLVNAYANGIFPWPVEGYPLLWFSPDPRFVLEPSKVHVGRSLRKAMNRGHYRITADEAFTEVIDACAHAPRPGQDGTWITTELRNGYVRLHQLGFAHSIEAWEGERLVGGLYGVSLGAAFFGESMYAAAPDASKVAFATLCGVLEQWDFAFVDCQVHTPHLERFGAEDWPRPRFLDALSKALEAPTRRGSWTAPFRRALER